MRMFTDSPVDHLDVSPSEAVRRHAATFRKVRLALQAREDSRAAVLAGEGAVDPEEAIERRVPRAVTGNGLAAVGARAAATFRASAAARGWAVRSSYARGRRGGDGPWVDSAAVQARRGGEWACGYWRAEPITVPFKVKWKFVSGLAWDPTRGTRAVGARELTAIVSTSTGDDLSDRQVDTLECCRTDEGGEESHGEDRS